MLADKEAGVCADTDRVHPIDHVGQHFRVAGPLNLPRSPQGRPVLCRPARRRTAATSRPGTPRRSSPRSRPSADAQEFYADIKARARGVGRDPDQLLKVLPGIVPGHRLDRGGGASDCTSELDELIQPEYALRPARTGSLRRRPDRRTTSTSRCPRDLLDAGRDRGQRSSRFTLIVDIVEREQLTVRQLIDRLGGARGHRDVQPARPSRSPTRSQEWFEQRRRRRLQHDAAVRCRAGWRSSSTTWCRSCSERGLFRTEYTGTHAARALRPRRGPPASTHHTATDEGDRMSTET